MTTSRRIPGGPLSGRAAQRRVAQLKHKRVAEALEREIRRGRLSYGERLPGESALAERFAVSRNTVRAALSELGDAGLITTRSGKGSFVTFDGQLLDARHGWARALRDSGAQLSVTVARCARIHDLALAKRLGVDGAEFVAVDRVRARRSGRAVSYECSRIPLTAETAVIPERGLVDGSLTRTLADAGLITARSEQWVSARRPSDQEAEAMGRDRDDWFLAVRRTNWTATGELAEHVESLLDPAHFQLHQTFDVT
jgi:GntR family transcriptional regulator